MIAIETPTLAASTLAADAVAPRFAEPGAPLVDFVRYTEILPRLRDEGVGAYRERLYRAQTRMIGFNCRHPLAVRARERRAHAERLARGEDE